MALLHDKSGNASSLIATKFSDERFGLTRWARVKALWVPHYRTDRFVNIAIDTTSDQATATWNNKSAVRLSMSAPQDLPGGHRWPPPDGHTGNVAPDCSCSETTGTNTGVATYCGWAWYDLNN